MRNNIKNIYGIEIEGEYIKIISSMKIIKSKKLKKLLHRYVKKIDCNNMFVYTYFRGIYNSRIFGYCIYRNSKMFNELTKK